MEFHAVHLSKDEFSIELAERWHEFTRGQSDLEPMPSADGNLVDRVRELLQGIQRESGDFVTVVIPELIRKASLTAILRHPEMIQLGRSTMTLFTFLSDQPEEAKERQVEVSLLLTESVEPLEAPTRPQGAS